MTESTLDKIRRQAKKKERDGHKPHKCRRCGKKLGMSQAYLAAGHFWCAAHRPR